MPELPEVETVKRGLESTLNGSTIIKTEVFRRDLRVQLASDYEKHLQNAQIIKCERLSKYLLIHLNNAKTLIFHLGMSGSLTIRKDNQILKKHDHIVLHIKNIEKQITKIYFNDPRRFGFSDILDTRTLLDHKYFKGLGVEPLSQKLTPTYLEKLLSKKKSNIKQALMNSRNIAGIGNIYACEILFRSHIHPLTPCFCLNHENYVLLTKNIKDVLKEAIKSGGSSLKDHKQSDGTLGYFQHNFSVYGQENKNCQLCTSKIDNITISNRSTFYCPKCQPKIKP